MKKIIMGTIKNKNFISIIYYLACLYLAIPFMIFSIGWFKWYFGVPMSLIIIICLFKIWNSIKIDSEITFEMLFNKRLVVFGTIMIIIMWILLSGISNHSYQNDDYHWRNGMFDLLIAHDWPIKESVLKGEVVVNRGYSYYCGFWLLPAVVGKVFGYSIGNLFQILWAFIGVSLVVFLIWNYIKDVSIWSIVLLIFFSGLDILGVAITGHNILDVPVTEHIEWWNIFQYSSFTTQLYWVFNQAIPAWIATMIILSNKNKKHILFIVALMMINCTMPFVGMLPFVFFYILKDVISLRERTLKLPKEILSFENIIGGGSVGIISFFFLRKSSISEGASFFSLQNGGWLNVSLFLFLEVLVYYICIYKYQKGNVNFYISLVILIVLPFIVLNDADNLCMRASIPSLFILYIMVCNSIKEMFNRRDIISIFVTCLILSIGGITPLHEIERSIINTYSIDKNSERNFKLEPITQEEVLTNDFESTDIESNLFYKYISK